MNIKRCLLFVFYALFLSSESFISANATGFTDLATCFTAKKGDNNPIKDLGKCQLHFYSSFGGGTIIEITLDNGKVINGQCPGESANYGLKGCMVNDLPGVIKIVGDTDYPSYCAWQHKQRISYCANPWNQ
jgi:hypothetical protein